MGLTEKLNSSHNRGAFCCESEVLNTYLKTQASQDQKRHLARVRVVTSPSEIDRVIGYFTLHAGEIDCKLLPTAYVRKLGNRSALPVAVLGRLAVDKEYAGQGLGRALVVEALQVALQSGIGAVGMLLDVLQDDHIEKRSRFYLRLGFQPLANNPQKMFLPFATLPKGFEKV